MRARTLAAFVATTLAAIGAHAPAVAAPPPVAPAPAAPAASAPSAADLATAKKLFETGLKLYGEGSYREALAAFLRANAIAPRASIQRNIAQCHRDLKDFASAYEAYGVLLSKYGATMSAGDKRTVERALEELGMLTGTVRVTIAEPGAAVAIDGHDAGTTPIASPIRVNLGTHTVTVSKTGFETLQKDVKLSGGDEAVIAGPLPPEVTTGHLVVNAPAGAQVEVLVDGQDVGAAPWEGDVKPGTHVIEAKGADRFSEPKQVDVARKARVELVLDLQARTGRVQIDTHTADADITVDAKPAGRGVWEGTLPAGEHQLSVQAPGFQEYRRVFVVHGGESFVEDVHLASTEVAPRYQGVYTGLSFLGLAVPSGSSNELTEKCPSPPCTTSSPLGAGIAVRAGYSFGWIAAEGFGFGSYDYSTASVLYYGNLPAGSPHEGVERSEDYTFHRYGGGGAIGARVATKHPHLRFTVGALGGYVWRSNIYKRTASPSGGGQGDEYTSDAASYGAPLLVFDAGVLVGWANGPKVHVGVLTMIELLGDPVLAPPPATPRTLGSKPLGTPPLQVADGTQVFLGPMIGFDFGL